MPRNRLIGTGSEHSMLLVLHCHLLVLHLGPKPHFRESLIVNKLTFRCHKNILKIKSIVKFKFM